MTKPLLLLVDDDAETVQVLGRMLAAEGRIQFALNGDDALRLARETPPDLILLDAEMPGRDGFSVCRALKADPQLAGVPVIFLTSHHDARTEATALNLGAADFVNKPPVLSQVVARIRAQLRASRLAREALQRAREQAAPPPESTAQARILLVDDDVVAMEAMRQALLALGARLVFAANGPDALRLAGEQPPDLVLLDIQMPGSDGFRLCRDLQALPALAAVPIVFVTRYADPDTEARALEAGGTDFIAKPFTPTVLQARIRNLLRLRWQADAALRAEREHWRRLSDTRVTDIVATASEPLLAADASGDVVLINAAACRLLQVSAGDAMGQPLTRWLPAAVLAAAHDGAIRTTVPQRDGPARPVEVSASRLGRDEEQLTSVWMRDLSAQEAAELARQERSAAEAASRTKSLMLSYFAHEIGNPLNGILGFARLMAQDTVAPLPDVQRQRLDHILHAGQLLQSLMRDVLDVNRFETGQFRIAADALDAAHHVREALDGLAVQAAERAVELHVSGPQSGLWMRGDADRLRQCVINLGSNGIKYNRRGGRLEVALSLRDGALHIAFTDQGAGMTDEEQAHLFEPFNRLGRDGQGHGIGLALTRQLVQAMSGQLRVRSAPGTGTCMTLVFPPLDAPPSGATP